MKISRRIKRILSNYYLHVSYKLTLLPRHPGLARNEGYDSDWAKFDHYDIRPLKEDTVKLRAVWAVDLYTPSVAGDALKRLERIEWRDIMSGKDGPSRWIENTRSINSGSWRNLGWITREESNYPFQTILDDLPTCFKSARFNLISITSSLSALVGCFYLNDESSTVYEEVARSSVFGDAVPGPRGSISIRTPKAIKEAQLEDFKLKIRRDIARFMANRFGTFFSNTDSSYLPIIDLLEFNNKGEVLKDFLIENYDLWHSDRSILSFSSSRHSHDMRHLSAFFNHDDLDKEDLTIYGQSNASSLIARYSLSIEANWAAEAVDSLLGWYERFMRDTRDRSFKPIVGFVSARKFNRIEKARELADVRLITEELSADNLRWLSANMMEFTRDDPPAEIEYLRQLYTNAITSRSKRLLNTQRIVSDVRRSLNESYAILQSSKMSKVSVYLAFVSTVLAVVALFVAILSSDKLTRSLMDASGVRTSVNERYRVSR